MQPQRQQIKFTDTIIAEIEQESNATRGLLEIVPEDKLGWRPHPKSMSLGQLALHIAMTQGAVASDVDKESANIPDFNHPEAKSRKEILQAFAESTQKAKEIVAATAEERLFENWELKAGDNVVVSMPRAAFWRVGMLNHYYHHRGQLSTYLRQLDLKLPSVYGPTADTVGEM